jgi:hypothetical protein
MSELDIVAKRLANEVGLSRNIFYSRRLVKELSKWIEQACSAKRITTATVLRRYRRLQTIRKRLGAEFEKLRPRDIEKLLGVAQDEFRMKLLGKQLGVGSQ